MFVLVPILEKFNSKSEKRIRINSGYHFRDLWEPQERIVQCSRIIDRVLEIESDIALRNAGEKRSANKPCEELNVLSHEQHGQKVVHHEIREYDFYGKKNELRIKRLSVVVEIAAVDNRVEYYLGDPEETVLENSVVKEGVHGIKDNA